MKEFLLSFNTKVRDNFGQLKLKAKRIKRELRVLYLACQRKDVPWYAKLVAVLVVGYALSPVDLIPDFVPVLGYLDDIIIVPLGISLVLHLIPDDILDECRAHADEVFQDGKPKNWVAGAFIIGLWILVLGLVLHKIYLIFF